MHANEHVQSLEEKTFQQERYCKELRSFRPLETNYIMDSQYATDFNKYLTLIT
jgi:hypothetical protein